MVLQWSLSGAESTQFLVFIPISLRSIVSYRTARQEGRKKERLGFCLLLCYNSSVHCPLLQCLRTTSAILAGAHYYFVVSSFKCEGKYSCHDLIHVIVFACISLPLNLILPQITIVCYFSNRIIISLSLNVHYREIEL
jgi:hypothetical protein